MKQFIVIDSYDSNIVEADDIEEAIHASYNSHYGFSHIRAVVEIPKEDEDN